MLLNRVETALMNNPLRAAVQRWYEAPLLERLARAEHARGVAGPLLAGKEVLEVGCGRGVGTEIVLVRFGAARVRAVDLDPRMVELARARLARFGAGRVAAEVGDATAVAAPEGSFDAVVDFGIIHHIPDWRAAVREVARVLRPGGLFLFEEVTRHALSRWSYRTFLEHPAEQYWFSAAEFLAALEGAGIAVGASRVERFFGDFVIGVGKRR